MRQRLRAILALLFRPSLQSLLESAQTHGSVVLLDMAQGPGRQWQCTIRPAKTIDRDKRWALNAWSGVDNDPCAAVLEAIHEAEAGVVGQLGDPTFAPKLGGEGYTRE